VISHSYADIGCYTIFPEAHFKRMFPTKAFGLIKEEDYARNKTYGIMCREEGLRITNELHRLRVPAERNIPYSEIAGWSNAQVKDEILTDDLNYVGL
jgi:hypothetical protein